ncbi:serine protease family [Plasmopara halstedii]|uniref:Serine protease family n=1 Tax=Plasmopara halstedii TaxID=4781 RepID=A0A0P1AR90_PLAHL|nr:serine protease family [Plasmopara halstedii]CEG43838.1 serine protease family [Plasmopara halstedii]|eukprot:XP_024580207.1 serine protease family [Plasmopara halstedii]
MKLFVFATIWITLTIAKPDIQLNGWYPCTQSSLQTSSLDEGHPDQFFLETASDSKSRRRVTAKDKQTQTSSLPFLQQSFEHLYYHHNNWRQQKQQVKTRYSARRKAAGDTEWSNPNKTVDVFVKRVKATNLIRGQKQKALWVLQGGPGASSTGVEDLMDTMYLELNRQAAEAGALGSPGGSDIRLEELPACMDDIRFQLDNQTAAFSVTSAAKDLAEIINYELSDQDVYVYGLSYGTYLVERLVHFTPASVKGFAVDGVVSESGDTAEKRATFTNWDYDVGIVGDQFLAACLVDNFCKSKFPGITDLSAFVHELYHKLDAAVADGNKGSNACADALSKDGKKPSYLLRSAFGEYLMSDRMRLAIPAVIYRASRCNDQDVHALAYFVEGLDDLKSDGGFGDSEPETLLYDSNMLYYIIVFSELWETPTPDKETLIQWYENATMASDNYLSLPYYCLFTGSREHACQELINLPVARPLVYERDQYWNKTGELPGGVTALLMTGGMDLQTRRMYGEVEYEEMNGERMLVSFDDAGHCTTFTTPTNGGGATCGVRILASFVKESGVLSNVNTSCMSELKPLKFSDAYVDAQELFGTSDLYEDIKSNQ